MPKIVLGIGNPEEKYAETRHNVGWKTVDALSVKIGKKFQKAGFEFWAAEGRLKGKDLVLVKTWTYVNQTGHVIPELKSRYGEVGEEFLVICDDVALPLGSVRIRLKGSSGGHNGLQSIADALGSDSFPRLRIGVGGGKPDPKYVLGEFAKDERPIVEETVSYVVEAIEYWMHMSLDKVMTQYNRIRKENDENV